MVELSGPPAPGKESVEYATFLRRAAAALLDSLVWIVGLSFFNPGGALWDNRTAAAIAVLVILSAWFNYFAFCEWRWGQTIGKNMLGLRVLSLDGQKLSWQSASVRNLLRLVDLPLALIGLDFIIIGRSPRRQRLGDRSADTIVVRERATGQAAPPKDEDEDPSVATAPGFPFATWELRRTLIGLVAGLVLAAVVAPLFVLPFDSGLDSTPAKLVAQGLFEATLVGTALIVAGARAELAPALAALGLRRPRKGSWPWVPYVYVSYLILAGLYAALIQQPSQKDVARDLGLDAGLLAAIFVFAIVAVLAPIAEEIFFRGMFFGGLRKRRGPLLAALISALIFGGLHATTGVSAVPVLMILGFQLALIYERTGSLWPGIALHMLNNLLALLTTL